MFRAIETAPPGVITLDAVGKVTEEDYKVWMPVMRRAIEAQGTIRLVMRFGPEFEQMTRRAILWDAMAADCFCSFVDRFAMLTDKALVRTTFEAVTPPTRTLRRVFPTAAFNEAMTWVTE